MKSDGVIVVDKPEGPTSHDIVIAVRRSLRLKKVGHLGTLDPLATGVLPLVVGRATRLASLFAGAVKQYEAVIQLGVTTDTADITGTVTGGLAGTVKDDLPSKLPAPETITKVASSFVGSYLQHPPEISAKKIGGIRAYKLARSRQPVQLNPVQVTLESLIVLSYDPPRFRCRVVCSSGFYVRAFARDLGLSLGCGGCLETLRRERHGDFEIADAVQVSQVVESGLNLREKFIPIDSLLPELPAVVVSGHELSRVRNGNVIQLEHRPERDKLTMARKSRIVNQQGNLLAIGEHMVSGALHPKIVLV